MRVLSIEFVRIAAISPLIIVIMASCSSSPKAVQKQEPAWVTGPSRTVEGGFIIYVGSGEDHNTERAKFKAESMALQDLANECSFAPKGTRIEDHFDHLSGVIHQAFSKVAVEFQDCESAKKAQTPEEIRTLANAPLTDQIKRYQEMVDHPEPEETQPIVVANGGPPPPPQDSAGFFIMRQQIAYTKEYVILAPAEQYPPGAPQTHAPIPAVAYASQNVRTYEAGHPELQTSHASFSNQRPNSYNHQAATLRTGNRMQRPAFDQRRGFRPQQNNPNQQRKRRKKRPNEP